MEKLHLVWAVRICRGRGESRGYFRWFREDACLGMAGRPAGWNAGRERKTGCVGCGQDLENMEFPVQNFKTYPRSNRKPWSLGSKLERNSGAGNFTSGGRLTRDWSRGFPIVFHRKLGGNSRAPARGWLEVGKGRNPCFSSFDPETSILSVLCRFMASGQEERSCWNGTFWKLWDCGWSG